MAFFTPSILRSDRLFPNSPPCTEQIVALSLLDATTANFALTSAIWLCERPDGKQLNLGDHLRKSLRVTLNAYPQWCGQLKSISTLDEDSLPLAAHARRFGRVYMQYEASEDPGVEFLTATSTTTLDALYPTSRAMSQPLWDREEVPLDVFIPPNPLAHALHPAAVNGDTGLLPPVLAMQLTHLACGGFVLAVKAAHPLADIASLIHFIKDWGRVSQSILAGSEIPILAPVFEPARLDALAAGDINAASLDPAIVQQVKRLPLHRYDWWAPSSPSCPWPVKAPEVFHDKDLSPVGKPMPWNECDVNAHVSHYVVHLDCKQVESIWKKATTSKEELFILTADDGQIISRHDAVLAHIWSCIARARNLQDDREPVHCDLVCGLRPALQLGSAFLGSPTIIINVEMPGIDVTATRDLRLIAQKIRQTIHRTNQPAALAAHLHTLAYEMSPQRIWQAFLGRRHILVTTWARAGVYDISFGLGERIRYADGMVPGMEGLVVIKEAPPRKEQNTSLDENGSKPSWTNNGVDISVKLRDQDMERLLKDPYLFPER